MALTERLAVLISANGTQAVGEFRKVGASAKDTYAKMESDARKAEAAVVSSQKRLADATLKGNNAVVAASSRLEAAQTRAAKASGAVEAAQLRVGAAGEGTKKAAAAAAGLEAAQLRAAKAAVTVERAQVALATTTTRSNAAIAASQQKVAAAQAAATQLGTASIAAGAGMTKLGQASATAGGLLRQNLAVAAGASALAVFKLTDAASDLAESVSKSRQVFGASSKEVETFGTKAAAALGLSKQSAVEAAATFGNLFRGLGQTRQEAATMSTQVVSLAADLASFNNLNIGDVLQDLRSGLVGEAEPIRKYGVLINEASVKTEAFERGIAKAGAVLTEQQKVAARYGLIIKGTATAQGDFARTSEGLANKQRISMAQIQNASATLGQAFIPAVAGAASVVGDLAGGIAAIPAPVTSMAVQMGVAAGTAAIASKGVGRLSERLIAYEGASAVANAATTRLGAALPKLGTAAVVSFGILELNSALNKLGPSTDKALASLLNGPRTLEAFNAEVKRLTDPSGVDRLTLMAQDIASAFNPLDGIGAKNKSGVDTTGDSNKIRIEQFKALAEASPVAAQQIVNDMKKQGQATQEFDGILNGVIGRLGQQAAAEEEVSSKVRDATDATEDDTAARKRQEAAIGGGIASSRALAAAQRGVANAARGVADAEDEVSDAQRTLNDLLREGAVDAKEVTAAQKGLESASRGVASAHDRVIAAEEKLAEIRQGADPLDLRAANRAVAEAQLGVADATNAITNAEQRLKEARAKADPAEIADAQRDLTRALLGPEAAADRLIKAQQDLAEIQGKGGADTKEVKDAVAALADERVAETDAISGQAEAQERLNTALAGDPDFTYKLRDAKKLLADAEQGVVDARQSLIDQNVAVVEAMRAVKENVIELTGREVEATLQTQLWGVALQEAMSKLPAGSPVRAELEAIYGSLQTMTAKVWTADVDINFDKAVAAISIFGDRWEEILADPLRQFADLNAKAKPPGGNVDSSTVGGLVPFGHLAAGGSVNPGAYVVGERGREVVEIPGRGYVHPSLAAFGASANNDRLAAAVGREMGRYVDKLNRPNVTIHQSGREAEHPLFALRRAAWELN